MDFFIMKIGKLILSTFDEADLIDGLYLKCEDNVEEVFMKLDDMTFHNLYLVIYNHPDLNNENRI